MRRGWFLDMIKRNMKIAIVDYKAGNLQNVTNALNVLGRSFEIVKEPAELFRFDKVILPGVGAAASAMTKLAERGFDKALPNLKVPVLGICLGLQLSADFSEEGNVKCLSIIPGRVKRFETDLKVPHMGWNKVKIIQHSPLLTGLSDNDFFYFVHSYYLQCPKELIVGETTYDVIFPSIVQKGNFYATQFHPEKSSKSGLQLLKNFCDLC